MGQFSWMDCKFKDQQILDDVNDDVYLLVPQQFGGGHIHEECYDGYGRFGSHDVYDLIADWNREFIPQMLRMIESGEWKCNVTPYDIKALHEFYEGKPFSNETYEKRYIGIVMACYDEDNERLPYPIKITHVPYSVYEMCDPSPSDPNQGWLVEEDEEYDDDWYDGVEGRW